MNRLLFFALACLVFGCSDPEPVDADGEVATFEETDFSEVESDELTVRAVYLGTLYDGDAVMVEHEAIPDFMPAMRMPFSLERPDLVAGLTEGDKVLLTIRNAENNPGLAVTSIETLPPDTVLDLEPDDADSSFVPGS